MRIEITMINSFSKGSFEYKGFLCPFVRDWEDEYFNERTRIHCTRCNRYFTFNDDEVIEFREDDEFGKEIVFNYYEKRETLKEIDLDDFECICSLCNC